MKQEVARLVVNCAMKISVELESIVPLLKLHASTEEEKELTSKILAIIESLNAELLRPMYNKFPEIERDVQFLMDKFGRIS
jgi:hypothetical protein